MNCKLISGQRKLLKMYLIGASNLLADDTRYPWLGFNSRLQDNERWWGCSAKSRGVWNCLNLTSWCVLRERKTESWKLCKNFKETLVCLFTTTRRLCIPRYSRQDRGGLQWFGKLKKINLEKLIKYRKYLPLKEEVPTWCQIGQIKDNKNERYVFLLLPLLGPILASTYPCHGRQMNAADQQMPWLLEEILEVYVFYLLSCFHWKFCRSTKNAPSQEDRSGVRCI